MSTIKFKAGSTLPAAAADRQQLQQLHRAATAAVQQQVRTQQVVNNKTECIRTLLLRLLQSSFITVCRRRNCTRSNVCLSRRPSLCPSVYMSVRLSAFLSVCPTVCLSIRQSIRAPFFPFICCTSIFFQFVYRADRSTIVRPAEYSSVPSSLSTSILSSVRRVGLRFARIRWRVRYVIRRLHRRHI